MVQRLRNATDLHLQMAARPQSASGRAFDGWQSSAFDLNENLIWALISDRSCLKRVLPLYNPGGQLPEIKAGMEMLTGMINEFKCMNKRQAVTQTITLGTQLDCAP